METNSSLSVKAVSDSSQTSCARNAKDAQYRWVILFVVWGAFLLSYIDRVAWSSVAAPVGQSLGISVAMLGAFVTAFYVGYVIANIVGGVLTDAFGAKITLTCALLPLGVATFCFSYTQSLRAGIAIQVIMGLAAGADYSAGVKIIIAWFKTDRGRAMGIYTTATSLAVVLANATIPSFSAAFGWQSAFKALGVVTCLWALVSVFLLRESPIKIQTPHVHGADFLLLLRNRNLILLALAGACAYWAVIGFTAWANALMTKGLGLSSVTAGAVAATLGVGAVVAKPGMGWLSDRLPRRRRLLAIGTLLAFSGALVAFGRASALSEMFVLAPILGVVAFGYIPLLIAQVTESSGPAFAGAAAGWTNATWQLGSAVSPLFVGYVYSQTSSFSAALMTLAIGPLLAVFVLVYVKTPARPGE